MYEEPVTFRAENEILAGIVHRPDEEPRGAALIVVGGPQFRVGSHRQFVSMARALAKAGAIVLRFDYRGMGDSSGDLIDFTQTYPDIARAVDCLLDKSGGLSTVTIIGLCDAATAGALYAPNDGRVDGVVLMNPWVRSEKGLARSYLKRYYLRRVLSPAFWRKLMSGEFKPFRAVHSLTENARTALFGRPTEKARHDDAAREQSREVVTTNLSAGMLRNLERFKGRLLVILSGNDLTAGEFRDAIQRSRRWRRVMAESRVTRHEINAADHTFSTRTWRQQVEYWICDWIFRV